MTADDLKNGELLDPDCVCLFLEVPGEKVVLLQGHFELYEGLGTVRTIDIQKSWIVVLTTPSQLENCQKLLEALKTEIPWKLMKRPEEIGIDLIH